VRPNLPGLVVGDKLKFGQVLFEVFSLCLLLLFDELGALLFVDDAFEDFEHLVLELINLLGRHEHSELLDLEGHLLDQNQELSAD